jgi:hypothetical protein
MGDLIEIHIAEHTEINGKSLSTPYKAKVVSVSTERLDHNKGDDVDGIVHRREIEIEPHPDDTHDQYIISTDSSILGRKEVKGIEARNWFEGRIGNGRYLIHHISFGAVELIDE